MKYAPYSTAAACGALLCATVLGTGNAHAAVGTQASHAAATLEHAARAIVQNTSGEVLKIEVDTQASASPTYDAVVNVNGRIEAVQMKGSSITPVAGPALPSWAEGYTPRVAKNVANAKLTIGEAIDIAARDSDGVPVSAEFTHAMNGPVSAYKVALAGRGTQQEMVIDARSGESIANDDMLDLKP